MTRLEPLIVAALGRSPYDDELITNEDPAQGDGTVRTGQQYDDRGRPINPETTQRTKDLVRASNEVLQAAGIIEPNSDFTARDKAAKAARDDEIENAYRRRAYGQILLTVGVWGTCGLRRRTLLYQEYSNHPLLAIIRADRAVHSMPHLLGAGLLAQLLNRAFGNFAHVYEEIFDVSSSWTRKLIKYGFHHVMFHYQYLAILQQLNLVTPHQLVPTLLFMVPFSAQSPLYLPPLPSSFSLANNLSWLASFGWVIAPYIILPLWKRSCQILINFIYDPLYELLPHPANVRAPLHELSGDIAELRQAILEQEHEAPFHPPGPSDLNSVSPTSESSSDTESDLNPDAYPTTSAPSSPETPTSDPHTLRALEGRARSPSPRRRNESPPRRRDSLATSTDDQDATQTTFISFDVEATDEPIEAIGSYSAELRNANYTEPPKSSVKMYKVTAMSLLPAHVAADGLAVLLSAVLTLPLEAVAIRVIGQSWRRKLGLGGGDMFRLFERRGPKLSLVGAENIVALFATDLLITSAICAVYIGGMRLWDWKRGTSEGGENKES